MSSSRATYTALTPEYADFAIPHTPVGPRSGLSISQTHDDAGFDSHDVLSGGRKDGCMRRWLVRARDTARNNTGLLLVASSQAFFSLMNVAVKKLNGIDPPVSTLELIVVRMGITYVCSMTYMLWTGIPDPFLGPKGVRLLLAFRGFIGFFGLFGIYYSLQYLSLSDATVLTFLAPMCTTVTGSFFLGEKFTRREALAGLVSLIGVVLIARPTALFGDVHAPKMPAIAGDSSQLPGDLAEKGTPRDRLIAVGMAMIGVIGATGAYTSIRAIGKRAHPLHSLTSFSLLCVVVSTTGIIFGKVTFVVPNRIEWVALLGMIGVFGLFAQVLLTMGLQRETAGRGTMAVYTQVVFATILERIFFKAIPTALSIIGTLLIISSAIYVALTKEQEKPVRPKGLVLRQLSGADSGSEMEQGLLSAEDDVEDSTLHDPDKASLQLETRETK
ncbi:hypothetical protein HYPSUDRAFT_47806 [Hypholoma sublateritium FD-334 SS-4]|uniref:EamA domain-containing protein n=1 Tax=Hypholoma sublateritium (strain FD-334 SS-4) TaxID=945553 RepID=A0A0D2P6M8_HYPSF|nr:hypothetical protein HYPSUDRAFT_47806 [Hypholoma sublateritium FD-334 SS-4]